MRLQGLTKLACHSRRYFPNIRHVIFALVAQLFSWWMSVVYISFLICDLDPISILDKTPYRKILWRLEAARFVFRTFWSLWNLTGTRQRCCRCVCQITKRCQNLNVNRVVWHFTRSYHNTSCRILKRSLLSPGRDMADLHDMPSGKTRLVAGYISISAVL